MKAGKLYGVGVGPGDPELLTLKAVRILGEAEVIAVPDPGKGTQTALRIARQYIEGKQLLYCPTPMQRDRALVLEKYREAADKISALLEEGKTVAFLTLGDPSIYSTYMYIHKIVVKKGFLGEIVPGIPSFCAAAARLGESLCLGSEPLVVMPATGGAIDQCLALPGTKVFMKGAGTGEELGEKLRAHRLTHVATVEHCTMEGEQVYRGLDRLDSDRNYFSIVIAKETP